MVWPRPRRAQGRGSRWNRCWDVPSGASRPGKGWEPRHPHAPVRPPAPGGRHPRPRGSSGAAQPPRSPLSLRPPGHPSCSRGTHSSHCLPQTAGPLGGSQAPLNTKAAFRNDSPPQSSSAQPLRTAPGRQPRHSGPWGSAGSRAPRRPPESAVSPRPSGCPTPAEGRGASELPRAGPRGLCQGVPGPPSGRMSGSAAAPHALALTTFQLPWPSKLFSRNTALPARASFLLAQVSLATSCREHLRPVASPCTWVLPSALWAPPWPAGRAAWRAGVRAVPGPS